MAAPGVIRSFIAIPLSEPVRTAVLEIQNHLKKKLADIRWVRPETMHLTLHFFGDIDEEKLEKAQAVMVSIESLFPPFSVSLSGVGAFPSPHRARVFWLGVHSDRIAELHDTLSARLEQVGFACDRRPFRPHLTLGRSRSHALKAGHILSQEKDIVAGEMTVDRLVLFESELRPTGAVHRPCRTIHFTAD